MARSLGKKDRINDVIERIELDHRCDGGDDARSCRCAHAGRAPLYGQTPVTSDRSDEQTENKTLQNASDDVADEQGVFDQIDKINKSDAEIGARNQTAREDRRDIRNGN